MNVVISNRSKAGIGKVEVSSNNQVGQVNFSKIAKLVGTLSLEQLSDVSTVGQTDKSFLVYNAANNNYMFISTLDGGMF